MIVEVRKIVNEEKYFLLEIEDGKTNGHGPKHMTGVYFDTRADAEALLESGEWGMDTQMNLDLYEGIESELLSSKEL